MFADPALVDEASEVLAPEDFGHMAHAVIFGAMIACESTGRGIDTVTVADELTRAGSLAQVGGLGALERVAAACAETPDLAIQAIAAARSDFANYLDIIADRSTRRRLVEAARTITTEAASGRSSSDELVESAEQAVFAVSNTRVTTSSVFAMPQVIERVNERMAKAATQELVGHSTGFKVIDEVTGGLQPGMMVTLAGRPGTGKSTLAVQIANHIAATYDLTVPVFSWEMQASEIGMRLLSAQSGVPLRDLMAGHIPHGHDRSVAQSAERLAQTRLLIDENPPSSITGVRSSLRRMSRRCELGAVVLDYMQLIKGSAGRRWDSRENEVADISRTAKQMGTEFGIPVIVCAQLNRSAEARMNKRPQLTDLRESGSIEQDSSFVGFLYRHHLVDPSHPADDAELIIAKNRNGEAPVTAAMEWQGAYTRFVDRGVRVEQGGGGFGGGGGGFGGGIPAGPGGMGVPAPSRGNQTGASDPFGF